MDATELKLALASHTAVLAARGFEIAEPEIAEPATGAQVDEVETQLGFPVPPTLREVLVSISCEVWWGWRANGVESFSGAFRDIFSGGLDWSLQELVSRHHAYLDWVDACFGDPANPYDAVWHRKLGLASVPNGDVIAVDLSPEAHGAIVYLSHDDGEGHGYRLAESLGDLLDRWVPLACPGPEDWQWLPFVPYDHGPIDPAGDNGTAWRQTLGLIAAPPRTPPSAPDDALFDELLSSYQAAGRSLGEQRVILRALRVCSTDRAEAVIGLLDATDVAVQEEAARTLGRWRWLPAIDDLKRLALTGSHNGRIAAMLALRTMPSDEAEQARDDLRREVGENWRQFLG